MDHESTQARRPGGRGRSSPDAIRRAQRDARALELRAEGRTFDEIATTLGMPNRSVAQKAVDRAMRATVNPASARELRDLELARLDALTERLWPIIEGADPDASMEATDRYLKVSARRSALTGLDELGKLDARRARRAAPVPATDPAPRAARVTLLDAYLQYEEAREAEVNDRLDRYLAEHPTVICPHCDASFAHDLDRLVDHPPTADPDPDPDQP